MVLAVKISQEQTKDQILENYLNAIYFGRGAYGIQAASQAYFGKDVKELTVAEGAMLAGMIQSPSRWDPAKNPDEAERALELRPRRHGRPGLAARPRTAPRRSSPRSCRRRRRAAGSPATPGGHVYKLARTSSRPAGITDQEINTEGLRIT